MSSLNNLYMEPEQVRAAANKLKGQIEEYTAAYEKLYQLSENLQVSYQGNSSTAYNEKLAQYRPQFQKVATVLTQYSDFLIKASQQVDGTDSELASSARSLP